MTTSIMMHGVKSVSADSFDHDNDNALTLRIVCHDTDFSLTFFGLPTASAAHLVDSLRCGRPRLTEEEIRADERRKIADKIGL